MIPMTPEDIKEYKRNAIEVLRENTQYATAKAVETVFDKQIPEKPLEENRFYGVGQCPACNAVFIDKTTKYCGNCGQAIDWGDVE